MKFVVVKIEFRNGCCDCWTTGNSGITMNQEIFPNTVKNIKHNNKGHAFNPNSNPHNRKNNEDIIRVYIESTSDSGIHKQRQYKDSDVSFLVKNSVFEAHNLVLLLFGFVILNKINRFFCLPGAPTGADAVQKPRKL